MVKSWAQTGGGDQPPMVEYRRDSQPDRQAAMLLKCLCHQELRQRFHMAAQGSQTLHFE